MIAAGLDLFDRTLHKTYEWLADLQRRAAAYAERDGRVARDEFFDAEQNARLVKNAEAYYRSMFLSDVSSWNLRDRQLRNGVP